MTRLTIWLSRSLERKLLTPLLAFVTRTSNLEIVVVSPRMRSHRYLNKQTTNRGQIYFLKAPTPHQGKKPRLSAKTANHPSHSAPCTIAEAKLISGKWARNHMARERACRMRIRQLHSNTWTTWRRVHPMFCPPRLAKQTDPWQTLRIAQISGIIRPRIKNWIHCLLEVVVVEQALCPAAKARERISNKWLMWSYSHRLQSRIRAGSLTSQVTYSL